MARQPRVVEVDRKEIIALTEVVKELQEEIVGINNKTNAMNKYYAQTVTVVNEQLMFIKETHDKIKRIYECTVPEQPADVIELTKKSVKKKVIKKK